MRVGVGLAGLELKGLDAAGEVVLAAVPLAIEVAHDDAEIVPLLEFGDNGVDLISTGAGAREVEMEGDDVDVVTVPVDGGEHVGRLNLGGNQFEHNDRWIAISTDRDIREREMSFYPRESPDWESPALRLPVALDEFGVSPSPFGLGGPRSRQ